MPYRDNLSQCNGLDSTKLHGNSESSSSQRVNTINESSTANQKLLATAIVKLQDKAGVAGVYHLYRALVDQGSHGIVM